MNVAHLTEREYRREVTRTTWTRARLLKLASIVVGVGLLAAVLFVAAMAAISGGRAGPATLLSWISSGGLAGLMTTVAWCGIVLGWIAFYGLMPAYAAATIAPLRKYNEIAELRGAGLTPVEILRARGRGLLHPFLWLIAPLALSLVQSVGTMLGRLGLPGSPAYVSAPVVWLPLVFTPLTLLLQMASLTCISGLCRRKWSALTACYLVTWVLQPVVIWGVHLLLLMQYPNCLLLLMQYLTRPSLASYSASWSTDLLVATVLVSGGVPVVFSALLLLVVLPLALRTLERINAAHMADEPVAEIPAEAQA